MKEPRDIVKKILEYKKSGTALDLGAGFGRNSIFLSQNGFKVTAVELHSKPLENLIKNSKENNVTIEIVQEDIRNYKPSKQFDVVISNMVLHFLSREEILSCIQIMKDAANNGGLNVISVYTDKNLINLRSYLFKTNELKDMYGDWKILDYDESSYVAETEDVKDGGPKERYVALLIAEKQ